MSLHRHRKFASSLVLALAVTASVIVPTNGQGNDNSALSALFNGLTGTSGSTPTTVISSTSSTTPTSTPSATPSSTPSSTPATTTAAKSTTLATTSTATPAAEVASPAAAPAATPVITPLARRVPPPPARRAPAPPPPPAPIVVDPAKLVAALPADQTILPSKAVAPSAANGDYSADTTAVDIVLRLSGPGVTPFAIPQQTVLLRAMASVLTSVSLKDLQIRYVTSAANSRRRLLHGELDPQGARRHLAAAPSDAAAVAAASGQLYNVASVTLQANCSSNTVVPTTIAEMQAVSTNNLLVSAIQSYGQPDWGVTLITLTAVNPNVPLSTGTTCTKQFGSFCLDSSSLSIAGVVAIIAVGSLLFVMLLAVPCVLLEWRRKSGMMAELEPTPQTPSSPLMRVQQMYNKLVDTVKAASPMHRGTGAERNAFKRETPSAKAGSGAVHLNASSR